MSPSDTMEVFNNLTKNITSRDKRLTTLLRDHTAEYTEGWHMCVRRCFNTALDIKFTERKLNKKSYSVWTQGSIFAFKKGDTLYNSSTGYSDWLKALKNSLLCIEVKQAADVDISNDGSRFPGFLEIAILTPNSDKSHIMERARYELSQDDFVKFLIVGPQSELKQIIEKNLH